MKRTIYIIFFLSTLVSNGQAIKQDKATRASMVYGYFEGIETSLESLYEYNPDLRQEVNRLNLLKTTNFGQSKKNAIAYLNSLGDWQSLLNPEIDSLKTQLKWNALISEKEEPIKYLKDVENILKGNIPSPILESVLAFQYENQPHKEFSNGYTYEFSTKGHKKSKNAEVVLTIPKSWLAKEGKNPNVIQLFTDDCGSGFNMISIMTQEMPFEEEAKNLTFEEIDKSYEKEVFTEEWGKSFVTKNEKFISFKPMRIANRSGCLLVLESITERMGMKYKMRNLMFVFHDVSYLHFITCSVGTGNINESLENIEEKLFPLYSMVVNSILIPKKSDEIIYLNGNSSAKTALLNIGGKDYKFLLDTGATISSINQDIFYELYQKGIISIDNFLKKDKVELANGEQILVEYWVISKLKIGNKTINDVVFAVQKNSTATPLLGMNILNKLDIWKIDLENNKIYLKN